MARMSQQVRTVSQFYAVPFVIQQKLKVEKFLIQLSAWQPPPLTALVGKRISNPDEQVLLITNEMPLSIYPWIVPIDKPQLEELHLQRFCSDYCKATGQRPYDNVSPGNNPPDFIGDTPDGKRTIDCTQFTIESRRTVYGLFQTIKDTLFDTDPSRFSYISGLLVYVWVDIGKVTMGLPLKKADHDELIDQLASYRFVPGTGQILGAELPQQAPDMDIKSTHSGWRFSATPLLVSAPSSLFFTRMGFEMAFVFPTEHTSAEAWSELNRLIEKHDNGHIADLIITVGAPDNRGNVYTAEEVVLDLMLANPPTLEPPKNLSRVFIHAWGTGRIIQLFPETKMINKGYFTASLPAHQQLVVP